MPIRIEIPDSEKHLFIELYEKRRRELTSELLSVKRTLAVLKGGAKDASKNDHSEDENKILSDYYQIDKVTRRSTWKEKISFALDEAKGPLTTKNIFDFLIQMHLIDNDKASYNSITSVLATDIAKPAGKFKATKTKGNITCYELK